MSAALDPERRGALAAAKLTALVREGFGITDGAAGGLPGGATYLAGSTGFYLADLEPSRSLGRALAWARQQDVTDLHVLADEGHGHLRRRAALFSRPVQVWRVEGVHVEPAEAAPFPDQPATPTGIESLVELLHQADVDVVYEHGEVFGEILGLEVARIVHSGHDGPRLEVGVGRHDREAFEMMHGDLPTPQALRSVVDAVREHRHADLPAHPLNRLAAERWLRRIFIQRPELIGATELEALPPVEPRPNVKDAFPAAAAGHDDAGAPVVVVCSVGVDLDLVPTAADVAARHKARSGQWPRLQIVLPERDALPVTRALADDLAQPAAMHTVGSDWRSYH